MRTASITTNTLTLYKAGTTTKVGAVVSYDAAAKRALLNPNANLQRGVRYKAVVTTGARDLAGNQLDQNTSVVGNQQKVWFFTTRN
jgi:Bacterial Ig-like domain